MKNCKKGFIVPLLLVIIAVLVIGGGTYIYQKNKTITTKAGADIQDEKTTDQNQSIPTSPITVSSVAHTSKNPVIKNVQQYDTDTPNLIKSDFKVTVSGENLFICNNPKNCEILVYVGEKSFNLMETPTNGYGVSFIPSNLVNGDYDLYIYNPVSGIRSNSIKIKVSNASTGANINTKNSQYTYNNTEYKFSIQYPPKTQVDEALGNQIETPSKKGKVATLRPISTAGYMVIEVEPTANCTNTASGSDPSYRTFNGINFTVYNLDRILSGNSSVSARLYCVAESGLDYKIITVLPYTNSPLNVDNDSALNQMLASFKFAN